MGSTGASEPEPDLLLLCRGRRIHRRRSFLWTELDCQWVISCGQTGRQAGGKASEIVARHLEAICRCGRCGGADSPPDTSRIGTQMSRPRWLMASTERLGRRSRIARPFVPKTQSWRRRCRVGTSTRVHVERVYRKINCRRHGAAPLARAGRPAGQVSLGELRKRQSAYATERRPQLSGQAGLARCGGRRQRPSGGPGAERRGPHQPTYPSARAPT
jgi:hypothetical protein